MREILVILKKHPDWRITIQGNPSHRVIYFIFCAIHSGKHHMKELAIDRYMVINGILSEEDVIATQLRHTMRSLESAIGVSNEPS